MPTTSAPASPERILVIRNRFLGDTVLAIPFLRNLRRAFPDAVIDVLVEPPARPVLAECPYVDEIMEWRRPRGGVAVWPRLLAAIWRLAWMLRRRRYNRVFVLKRSLTSALVAACARVPHRTGFAVRGWPALLTRAVPLRSGRHEAELFLDILRHEGIPVDDGHNENWVAPAAAERVAKLLARAPAGRPRVFVSPRSTDERREWPVERMACIVRWLVERRGCEIFFCGAPDDAVLHGEIRNLVGPGVDAHVHDHSLDFSLGEAVALIARMDLCVGVDTGLPHVAASFGVPTAVLYGPTDPAKWHPWRTDAAVLRSASGEIGAITVGEVAAAVGGLLDVAVARRAAAPRRKLETVDLRQGRFRYAVYADTSAPAVAHPATKPLAHAH